MSLQSKTAVKQIPYSWRNKRTHNNQPSQCLYSSSSSSSHPSSHYSSSCTKWKRACSKLCTHNNFDLKKTTTMQHTIGPEAVALAQLNATLKKIQNVTETRSLKYSKSQQIKDKDSMTTEHTDDLTTKSGNILIHNVVIHRGKDQLQLNFSKASSNGSTSLSAKKNPYKRTSKSFGFQYQFPKKTSFSNFGQSTTKYNNHLNYPTRHSQCIHSYKSRCYKCLYFGHQQAQCPLTWCNRCLTWGHTPNTCDATAIIDRCQKTQPDQLTKTSKTSKDKQCIDVGKRKNDVSTTTTTTTTTVPINSGKPTQWQRNLPPPVLTWRST